MIDFRYLIILWYGKNKRDLPWRQTSDPYRIWVSEVILQQTRVEQGLAYYQRLIARFPDIDTLANAEEDELMKIWQGLGYYTRARNMHQAAKNIRDFNQSNFPASYDELKRIKGIGDYTASAISSIAYGEIQPVVDGNVTRVIARFEGLTGPANTLIMQRKLRDIMMRYIDREDPGTFNQAVMELGALLCKPKNPLCKYCPVREGCYAYEHKMTASLPVLNKPGPVRDRFFHYLVILCVEEQDKFTWIKKRMARDIWMNLYDFPLIEAAKELNFDEIQSTGEWNEIFSKQNTSIDPDMVSFRHSLSHQRLNVNFIQVKITAFDHPLFIKTNIQELHKYPVPRLLEKYLKKIGW